MVVVGHAVFYIYIFLRTAISKILVRVMQLNAVRQQEAQSATTRV